MKPPKSAAPGRLLTQVAGERRTGALIVGGPPGGTVYLVDGQVTYAESAAAPGVGELLTASGRLAPRTWQAALDAGTSRATVGQLLLDQGHITQGELELCVLGATYDAAYFALSPAAAPVDFLEDATHWLGPVVRVDPAAITRESRRRARLLDEIFPYPQIDTAVVIPVTRPPRERITLTAAQWELLVHSDGQRTPADLAQLLGRAGYATIQELRRLAAAGLLELPAPREPAGQPDLVRLPRMRGTAVDIQRPVVPGTDGPTVPIVTGARPGLASGDPPPQQRRPDSATANGTAYRAPRLARRKPGAKLPKEMAAEPAPAPPSTDEVLLKRIRTALKALR
ncbi:DUF4388 domain-containing protein [Actinoplanes sp. NPDC049681]|uniref:DUF4388 domain-containing protein n=1 Tax=Actinoplanes sp. NPDC049681 TaxID=3363905 RepID=UPI003797A421